MSKSNKSKATDKTDPKKGRYIYCSNCGSRQMINGTCKKCGFTEKPKNSTKAEKKTSEDAPQETK